jgi:dTMP kinase
MGLFITFEGPDGSGKTTVAKKIVDELLKLNYQVIYTREPGGSNIAEEIRNLILDVHNTAMDPRTEALLYAASRRQHLIEKILPALQQNKIVICDRYVDSSLVYQGFARKLGIDTIYQINKFAINDYFPDLTIYCDIDAETGLERIYKNSGREINRLDLEQYEFHRRVVEGYQEITKLYPERNIINVDAKQAVDKVFTDALKIVLDLISKHYAEFK